MVYLGIKAENEMFLSFTTPSPVSYRSALHADGLNPQWGCKPREKLEVASLASPINTASRGKREVPRSPGNPGKVPGLL